MVLAANVINSGPTGFHDMTKLEQSVKTQFNNNSAAGWSISSVTCVPAGDNSPSCLLTVGNQGNVDVTVNISPDGNTWINCATVITIAAGPVLAIGIAAPAFTPATASSVPQLRAGADAIPAPDIAILAATTCKHLLRSSAILLGVRDPC